MIKTSILSSLPAMLFVAIGLLLPATGTAASCTPGTDCYCDKVKNPSSPLYDPSLLFCEDFEAPTLYNDQGVGDGPPYYGPWYDNTGWSANRGNNSYWAKTYGNGVGNYLFESGSPSNPSRGSRCSISLCTGTKAWDARNRWSANGYQPLLAIFTDASDFNAEVRSLDAPTNTADGTPGVFDGNATLAFRIPPGESGGIAGAAGFPTTRTIGLTMAVAYPRNALSAGIIGAPGGGNAAWKHNEWSTAYGNGNDGLFAFYNQADREDFPFAGFIGSFEDQNDTNCSSANTRVGETSCLGSGLGINWSAGPYDQATDFPMGTWGCIRGYIENAGTSNQRFRVWFQGPDMASERLIVDFTMNATRLDNKNGYTDMVWNAYANTNQGGGYVSTTETTFRYEDNVHARQGTPVPCSQIGYGGPSGGGGPVSLPSPNNLRVN
jgi:hypothetical protein